MAMRTRPGRGHADRDGRQRAWDQGEEERGPDADGGHQHRGEQRANHRAQVVAGPLHPKGPPVGVGWRQAGQHGVPGRGAGAPGDPGGGPQHPGLPDGRGQADGRGEHRGQQVPAAGQPDPAGGLVGQRATEQLGHAQQGVRQPLDQSQGGGRPTQHAGQEAGQDRGGDLVAGVAEEAGGADTRHLGRDPWGPPLGRSRGGPSDLPTHAAGPAPGRGAGSGRCRFTAPPRRSRSRPVGWWGPARRSWEWRRDRLDDGGRVRPDQQDRAGGVVDHEPGRRPQAGRAESGAVPVARRHQQVGVLGGLDHQPLDPTAA